MQRWILFLLAAGVIAAGAFAWATAEATGDEVEDDDAGEAWGYVAAVGLGASGATAIWNLIRRRWLLKALRQHKDWKKRIAKWHRKVIMPVHAGAGVVALATGLIHGVLMRDHWTLWVSMGIMGFLVVGGALLQWKWTPSKVRKGVYLLHTQQTLFVALIALLVIGHAFVD
ncbi:MAG: hypothetical protein ACPGQL_05775 [Thermoplasmatota archaeon]